MNNLSDVFKYISHYRHAGHQVGRKVGDMLEILTYASIARNFDLYSRLNVEPKLYGFSDAGHKVEFVILNEKNLDLNGDPVIKSGGELEDLNKVIGFIECKKVGVEQTVNQKFKRTFEKNGNNRNYKIPIGQKFQISFAPKGFDKQIFTVMFENRNTICISKIGDKQFNFRDNISNDERIIFALDTSGVATILGNRQSLRDFPDTLKNCRILEIISCEDDHILALLNDCLAGPQTPEKAKQASFVALDVRKRRFNSFDKRDQEKELVSVLVLTEFSHWEKKSLNMIRACIDVNLMVEDKIIIEAFIAFEEKFGKDFYDKVTKEKFENDSDVRQIACSIIEKYDGKIFQDIDDHVYKKIVIQGGHLAFTS